jgi:hypothetical protein
MLALDSDVCPTQSHTPVAPLNTYTFLKKSFLRSVTRAAAGAAARAAARAAAARAAADAGGAAAGAAVETRGGAAGCRVRTCVTAGFELASRRLVLVCPAGLLTRARLLASLSLALSLSRALRLVRACVVRRRTHSFMWLVGPPVRSACWLAWWVRRDCWVCVGLCGSVRVRSL